MAVCLLAGIGDDLIAVVHIENRDNSERVQYGDFQKHI